MKVEEAIECINAYRGLFPEARSEQESLEMAIEALQKQIPMTPKFYDFLENATKDSGETYIWECPNCKVGFSAYEDWEDAYCPECGQKLDWEDM